MCGIAGFIGARPAIEPAILLARMTDTIRHRGPDDLGQFHSTIGEVSVALGHRRLSIIDLATGHQPIGNEDGTVQIVFNGEIYNYQELRSELLRYGHRFATDSDTETIVHAYEQWGVACVDRFRGMFAFAIWDANRRRLFLARDRFGKKPLFIHETNGTVYFASEIKALLAVPTIPRELDPEAVWEYLAYRYVPAPRTLLKGVVKLLPGNVAVWEGGRLSQQSYYSPPDGQPRQRAVRVEDPVNGFMSVLEESVRLRMIADVPFGAFLSGGIDSSAVVGLMSRISSAPIKTFSVGFKESHYSELGYAKTVADCFGTDHHELVVSHEDIISKLPELVRYRDAPVSEPADIPIFMLATEARKSVKMVLTGEGSDEVLGGYPKHVVERFVAPYQTIPRILRTGVLEPLVRSLPYGFRRIKTAIESMGVEPFDERMARWFGAMPADECREWLRGVSPAWTTGHDYMRSAQGNSALRNILFFDQVSWLPDNLLERGDRMTMAASLEARMPFMDHKLVEFVSTLPDNYRVKRGQTKVVLRQAVRQLLPDRILNRPKVGFRVPVNEWFRGSMRDYLTDMLTAGQSQTSALVNQDKVRLALQEHIEGRFNHEKLLWALLGLEIWAQCTLPATVSQAIGK